MSSSPIKYTSRDFLTIQNDINSVASLAGRPSWWKNLWAGIGDMVSMLINAGVNDAYLRTAFTRKGAADLLELINYFLSNASTSSGDVWFYMIDGVTLPKTFTADDLVASTQGNITASAERFEARSSETVSAVTETGVTADAGTDIFTVAQEYYTGEKIIFTAGTLPAEISLNTGYYVIRVSSTEIKLATSVSNAFSGTNIDLSTSGTGSFTVARRSFAKTLYQQETKDSYIVGTSDGTTAWQEFDLRDSNILKDTVQVWVGATPWTVVDRWINSQPTDEHLRVIYREDGSAYIQFGDGVNFGAIPGNQDVTVSYAVGGGIDSNISPFNSVNVYAGSDTDLEGVANYTAISGGAEEESIENGKILGPALLDTRDTFITPTDGKNLLKANFPVSLVNMIPNAYGVLSTKVQAILNGGGNPSTGVKASMQTYLLERTLLEEPDIRVVDATLIVTSGTFNIKVKTGYTFAGIQDYVEAGLYLTFSETGQEISELYETSGISAVLTYLNTALGTSFSSQADSDQIEKLVIAFEPADFGKSIQASDVGIIDSLVDGVDYYTTSLTFPILIEEDEISSFGSMTILEIP